MNNDHEVTPKNEQVTSGTGGSGPTGTPFRPSTLQILLINRMREIDVARELLKTCTSDEEFSKSIAFRVTKKPKSSCKYCFGRGYFGTTDVFWYEIGDGSYSLSKKKDAKRISYTRIYPCTCIKGFTAVKKSDLVKGDLYLEINGGAILVAEGTDKEKVKDQPQGLEKE